MTAQPNSDDKGDRTDRWLTQRPVRNDPWHRGPTLEQTALESCHSRDEHGLVVALKRWMRCLEEAKVQTAEHSTSHPFSPAPEAPSLPDDMLDVSLSNFVLSGEKVVFVDREWRVDGGVDLGLAGLRALWFFVLDLINGGARHPWSDDLTVDTVCLKMAAICGLPAQQSDLDRMYSAEAELQSLVIGFDSERVTRDLRGSGQATLANPNACCPTRWTHLHKYAQSTSESESVDPNQLVQNQARIDQLEKSLASANALAADLETSLSKSHDHALSTTVEHQQNLSSLQKKNEALQTKLSALEAQVPIKIYQRLRWWFSGR